MDLGIRTSGRDAQRGSALIAVLFTVIALGGISAALVTTSLYRQRSARGLQERERAYEMAQTGADVALFELKEGLDVNGDGVGNVTGNLGQGNFNVTITPPFAGPGEYSLQSSASVGPALQAVALVVSSSSTTAVGMFGKSGVSMVGNATIDSYDSTVGTYGSQLQNGVANANANISSNGDIVAGGGMVYGDATPGPTSQVLGDPTNVTGSTAPSSTLHTFATPVYVPTIPSAGNYSGTASLTTGSYRFGQLSLSGKHSLTLDGDISLYVDHAISIAGKASIVLATGANVTIYHGSGKISFTGGGLVNSDGLPGSLTVSSASTDTIKVAGGSDFHGVIYAPDAEFKAVGKAGFFGGIVADTIAITGNGNLHLDESSRAPSAQSTFAVKSARASDYAGN